MNEQRCVDICLRLSCRACKELHGISLKTWLYVRKHGKMPPSLKCGAKEDLHLTTAILEYAKKNPHHSCQQVAFAVGCCKDKVSATFKKHELRLLWQRLRYADIQLKELDPDLVKARANKLQVEGPGALVHIDTKRYAYLEGGVKIIGITIVDNYSGYATFHLCQSGQKTADEVIEALNQFMLAVPCDEIMTLYSDNGTEFINSKVMAWCERYKVRFKHTQPAHPWSNGKAEVTQRLIKLEVILPLLTTKTYTGINALVSLKHDIALKMHWYNYERPHFGRINQGLTPYQVVDATYGLLTEEERQKALANLRQGMRWKNRAQWLKTAQPNEVNSTVTQEPVKGQDERFAPLTEPLE